MLYVYMFSSKIVETVIWDAPWVSQRRFFWEWKTDNNDWNFGYEYAGSGGSGSSYVISKSLSGAYPGRTLYCRGGFQYSNIKHYTFEYSDVCPYPKCFVKPAEKRYSNSVYLHCGIYFDSRASMTIRYKLYPVDNPSYYKSGYYRFGDQSGTKWHNFYEGNLSLNRKYAFFSYWDINEPQTHSEILTFTLPTMSYKFRAFGVKPNQEDVYGEYKYFERQ